ncbi:esterase-like activity of phytase family protein [Plastorhodobacter daqingensis]|uniref:Esterase-like activity of phytase family protein n=1 Tax=Plastorhodobacter daqingensis TaxID=1387281 RepID=A0ABW2UQR4_9RHOB
MLVSSYNWPASDHGYGGFSGIALDADGRRFTAISDRGAILRGELLRGDDGQIRAIRSEPAQMLRGPDGAVLPKAAQDAEGLAINGDGRIFISFEGVHRVLRYDTFGGTATALPTHPDFAGFGPNKSLESLAVAADGTLYTLPEEPVGPQGFPVYRFRNGSWEQPFHIAQMDGFLAVEATFGPDGRFYLLERDFRLFGGFTSRVRRFEISDSGIDTGETLFQSRRGQHDNLEGLSVWRDPAGAIRLTLISDDNFLPVQRTEIVEYRLTP